MSECEHTPLSNILVPFPELLFLAFRKYMYSLLETEWKQIWLRKKNKNRATKDLHLFGTFFIF